MELLSNKIREYRFRNGEMTQKALAERVGVSRQTMNAIDNCRHAPTVTVAIRTADVFQVSVDQLFALEYESKPARRTQSATVDNDRSQTSIEVPIKHEQHREPSEKHSERKTTLADLRGII